MAPSASTGRSAKISANRRHSVVMLPHRQQGCTCDPHLPPAIARRATALQRAQRPHRPQPACTSASQRHSARRLDAQSGRVALLYFGSHSLRGNRFGPAHFTALPCVNNAIYSSTLRIVPRHQSRVGILKNRSLSISAGAALAAAAALAGCGNDLLLCRPRVAPQRARRIAS